MSISKFTFIRFTRGDQKAVEKVYLEYKNLMYFVIASYVPNKLDVEDILSDSFIKAVEHREEVRNPDSLKAYLAQIAKNEALNFLKQQREVPSSDVIEEMYGEEDRTNSILNMIEPLLSNKETIVVYLRVIYSYSWDEIQEETGIPNSTARRLYSNAKAKLRKELSWTLMKETS